MKIQYIECPDCGGDGAFWDYYKTFGQLSGAQYQLHSQCQLCQGTGKINPLKIEARLKIVSPYLDSDSEEF